MRVRIRAFAAMALITLMPLARPLQACCDDFWSCLGAVATAGLSCVVENLINSIRSMIQNVTNLANTLRNQATDVVNLVRNELGGAANDLRNLVTQAENDFNAASQLANQSVQDANRIQATVMPGALATPHVSGAAATTRAPQVSAAGKLTPPSGGVTPAHPPAGGAVAVVAADQAVDTREMKEALGRGKEAIDRMRNDVRTPADSVRSFAQRAEQQAQADAATATNIAESLLLSPLRTLGDMLQDLINHPDHIFDPAASVDAAVTSITNQTIDVMNQVHDAAMRDARALLDQARQPAIDAGTRAAAAKKIAQAMDNLQKRRTRGNLEALNALVPRAPLPVVQFTAHIASFTHASGLQPIDLTSHQAKVTVPFNRLAGTKLTARTMGVQMGSRVKTPWMNFKRLQAEPVKPVPEAKGRADAEIERRFAGKTPEQAAEVKRALLAEARTRFAKDPKTLQKVEDYLNGHPAFQRIVSPRQELRQQTQ